MPPPPSPNPETSSPQPRFRTHLRFGTSLYRRLSSLRLSKQQQQPSPSLQPSPQPSQPKLQPISNPSLPLSPDHKFLIRRESTLATAATHLPTPAEPEPPAASPLPVDFYLTDNPPVSQPPSVQKARARARRSSRRAKPVPALDPPSRPAKPAPQYALDSSPVESYDSRNMRAERVANALERIAKQTSYFDDAPTDMPEDDASELDALTPKEALIPLIVESMVQHVKDPKVADRALTTLRRLTVSDVCRRKIGECGGIEAIVEIMRSHSLRVRIQTQACLALANLAYHCPENKEHFMRCQGLKVVVAALSIHRQVEHVQAWGCLAIRNFTNGAIDAEQHASVTSGAVEVLVVALEQYPRSDVVQQQSMIALTNIASSTPLGMDRIRSVGGIQSLVNSMVNNVRSASLSEIALSCARVLVDDEKNQRIFGHDGGIEAITAILDEHRGHVGIAVKGCAAFRQLAFQRDNRDTLGRCGGIRAIVTAIMDTAASSSETATHLLKALSNSTYDSLANKTLAGRLGGVEATLALLTTDNFRTDVRVVEDACRVLRNLADGVLLNHRLMIKNRGIAVVLDAARSHGTTSPGVAEHSIAIFVNLAANRGVAAQVQEGSGDLAEIAKRLKVAHPGNSRVSKQAEDLLSMLDPLEDEDLEPISSRSSGWRDSGQVPSLEQSVRSSKSLRRTSSREEDQLTRLQRLRSLPLPMSRQNRW